MQHFQIADYGAQFAREPILRRMSDNSLICTFLTGGPREPDNANVIQISRSFDDGENWTAPETLFSHGARGVWCTEIFAEDARPFMVVQTYNAACGYRELQTFRSFCADGGKSWSEPQSFSSGLNGVSLRQGIVLSNGEYLFPLYWQETRAGFDWTKPFDSPFCCGVAVSSDGGDSWQRYGYFHNKKGFWEPNCIEAEPGHILCYMRNNDAPFLALCESFDYGRSWTEPRTTGIPNPNSKLTLFKIQNVIFLINNFCQDKRTHLELHRSADGLTWTKVMDLTDPEALWFYPHAYADSSRRMLYIAYENCHQHELVKLTFDEIGL